MTENPGSRQRATPGVYINEIDAFGTNVVGVQTAAPVFIGYTCFAGDPASGKPLYHQPVLISSMAEYIACFGGPALRRFTVAPAGAGQAPDFVADCRPPAGGAPVRQGFVLAPSGDSAFNLYWQLALFFANGGSACYVVSAGSYWAGAFPAKATDPAVAGWHENTIAPGTRADPAAGGLLVGLDACKDRGPTMIVIPEACLLNPADYQAVVCAMLDQAGTLQDRVAILDLPDCLTATTLADLTGCQQALWTAIAPQYGNVAYGAAYGPALNAAIVGRDELLFTGFQSADNSLINDLLTTQAAALYHGPQLASVQHAINSAFPLPGGMVSVNGPAEQALNVQLCSALPLMAQLEQLATNRLNVAPPSGVAAGAWARNDAQNGVWNAPAGFALVGVVSPLCDVNDTAQAGFNAPANGQSINIIRAQAGRGTVIWGARTLDGKDDDPRYIAVRRTLIYVEQSIKQALQSFAFAANDAATWSRVVATISTFLTGLWAEGGLVGSKASEAFMVSCGVGVTMTGQDILDGNMVVAVLLQLQFPGEYSQLTFTQAMYR